MKREIRRYTDDDLGGVLAAWESASLVAHPFLTPEFMAVERRNIPEVYLPNAETWVVEQDGSVIGFIALVGNEVGAIFVHPDFHGTGAGWALMEKAKQLHTELELEVFEANSIGRRFYARCGFQQVSSRLHEETGYTLLRLKFNPIC